MSVSFPIFDSLLRHSLSVQTHQHNHPYLPQQTTFSLRSCSLRNHSYSRCLDRPGTSKQCLPLLSPFPTLPVYQKYKSPMTLPRKSPKLDLHQLPGSERRPKMKQMRTPELRPELHRSLRVVKMSLLLLSNALFDAKSPSSAPPRRICLLEKEREQLKRLLQGPKLLISPLALRLFPKANDKEGLCKPSLMVCSKS